MAKDDQTKKGQGAAKGITTVAPGMTGKPSEEFATELGAGKTAGATTGGAAGAGSAQLNKAGATGTQAAREFNEFASELAGAGATTAKKGGAGTKKQK